MDNNILKSLTGIFQGVQTIIKVMETGEGLGIPDDKKEEFKNKMKEAGSEKIISDLKEKMNESKQIFQKINGTESQANKE